MLRAPPCDVQRPGSEERRDREQVKDAGPPTTPNPATELMELRQPEPRGLPDQNRVGPRHVEAALDDRGGKEHVAIAVGEADLASSISDGFNPP